MAVNVPKRQFKRAVQRNLLKRRTREAFRHNKQSLYQTLACQNKAIRVFFHYVAPELLDYAFLETTLREALAKLADRVTQSGHRPADPAD